MKKHLEDRYIVIKKADVDASALNCLTDHLRNNGIPQRTGMFVEVHHDVYPQVRNLCIYGTVYGPDLLSMQELDTETITSETCGDLTRTVTERVFRSKPETVLAGTVNYFGAQPAEDVSPEVTRHQAEQLGAQLPGCQTVQPIGYYCTRAFGHTGPCACTPHAAPPVHKPPTDLDMYAYYIQNGLTDYAYKLEQTHLLDGYPPELVTIGLAAIEDGKDPIYAIQCYTEKSEVVVHKVPEPVAPAPYHWNDSTPPAAPAPSVMPAPMMQPPAATYCAQDGCPGDRMVGTRHCSAHQPPPMMPPVLAEAPVYGCETCKDTGRVLSGTKRERRCSDCVNGE